MFLWFSTFAVVAALAEMGYLIVRYESQRLRDTSLSTYELTFPHELSLEIASRLFTALAGIYPPIGRYGHPFGRPTVVFEVLATPEGLHHLVSFPAHLEDTVRGHLRSIIPNIGFNAVVTYPVKWNYAVELQRHPANETEADPHMVAVLLSSMRELQDKERVLIQFVITPTGLKGKDDPPYWAVGRLAAHGHDIRAKALIQRTLIAYRSLNVFQFRRLASTKRVSERAAPLAQWPIAIDTNSLAVICGLPIGDLQIPGLTQGRGRRLVAEASIPREGIVIGQNNYAGSERPVAIAPDSLNQHLWLLGPTGAGKSTLLHNVAAQIMAAGQGLILIEPKGDLARSVLGSVPAERIEDVIWFDPSETDRPIGLNVLAGEPERVTGHIVGLFKSLYGDSWGPRLEMILKYAVLTAAMNELTLYDVKQLLVNKDFRTKTLRVTKDLEVRQFWRRLDEGPDSALDSVINKLDAFVGPRAIRNIVGQTNGLSMAQVLAEQKILIVPLTAELGEANADMFGQILFWQLWQAVRTAQVRRPTTVILDEFQRFTDTSVAMEDAFSQARSYQMSLVVANQTTSQLSGSVLQAVKGNAASKIVFRMAYEDAQKMSRDFAPLDTADLQALDQYEAAASLLTPAGAAPVATVKTAGPPRRTGAGPLAREASRAAHGVDVHEVEAALATRHKPEDERPKATIGRREN